MALAMMMSATPFYDVHAATASQTDAQYANGLLTISMEKVSVSEALGIISRTAGMNVYVAKEFSIPMARNKSLRSQQQPVEEVLKDLLQGINYAVEYVKEGDEFRIASVKLFSEGMFAGEVTPLFLGYSGNAFTEKNAKGEKKTVFVTSGGEVATTQGQLEKRGILMPSSTNLNNQNGQGVNEEMRTPWFAMQAQFEQDENKKYQELMALQKQVETATDGERKKALTAVYNSETAKFYEMKKAHLNKTEALKRITQYNQQTGN